MLTRREFVGAGFGAVAMGLTMNRARGGILAPGASGLSVIGYSHTPPRFDTGALPLGLTRPILNVDRLPSSTMVGGFPFAPWFTGDDFQNTQIPFHSEQNNFPGGSPPTPTEEVDIVVVGGGLAGLATAYHLRHRRPVVFELHDRFGGNSQGEEWLGTKYSLGGAYFIAPDEGSSLDRLYRRLGATRQHRLDTGGNPVELGGRLVSDFWSGASRPAEERAAFARYAEVVSYFANERYPDIPLDPEADNAWILELDGRSFREDLEQRMGMAIPPVLAGAIQSYFYSSFNAGWEEVSAAAGWNFVAAEEYGRWVCPGGNSFLVDALWRELAEMDRGEPMRRPGRYLRGRCRVVDVRFVAGDRQQVTYIDSEGQFRSLLARRVVMATPKHVAKHIVQGIEQDDPDKYLALSRLNTRAYLVANVLLDQRLGREFYDMFRLGDGTGYPMSEAEAEADPFAPDVVDAKFGDPGGRRSVLTVYWSLPYYHGRFHLIFPNAWDVFTQRFVPQLESLLHTLNVERRSVRQVRITRWGHSMPIADVGFLANGLADQIRRPIRDRVFFVNQDNWALPAVETCLLEAEAWAPLIEAGL